MARIEKTVFISYRRTNLPWALAVYQNLTQHGFDVFLDYTGIASGDFESVILENIHARAHFLVLLTPSALERCGDPGDWLRREIEAALDSKRNIVPLTLEGFDLGTPTIANQLTGALAALNHYNALSVPPAYFFEAMVRLRDKYLNVRLDAVLHPAPLAAREAATYQKHAAAGAPPVAQEELTALQWFERGFNATDPDEQLRFYSEAIRLQPDFAYAFNNRGAARLAKGDSDGALEDYDEAIRLKPDYAYAFNNRGAARFNEGDSDLAVEDFDEAIRLKPDYAEAFSNRGLARFDEGDTRGAFADLDEAVRLEPNNPGFFYNRGNSRADRGDLDGALSDFDDAVRLQPDDASNFNNRGTVRLDNGDLDGALADFNETIRLNPGHARALSNRDLVLKAIADRSKS
ncbi:MAG: tetratricopeptide repeat protein [Candidatus Korobacteraceae bacterium]